MKKKIPTRLIVVTLISALLLPALNIWLIRAPGVFFSSDTLTYPEEIGILLGYAYNILGSIIAYLAPISIAYALITKNHRLGVILICALSVPVVSFMSVLSDVVIDSAPFGRGTVYEILFSWLTMLVVYAIVLAAVLAVNAAKKKAPQSLELFSLKGQLSCGAVVCVIAVALITIFQRVFDTYIYLLSSGAILSRGELIAEYAVPCAVELICAFFGYILGYAVMRAAEGSHKSRELRK